MPKALWIAHVNVLDADKLAAYASAATPVIAAHGGVFLARGGAYEQLEGPDHTRNVVAQFPSLQAAHDCYHSRAIKLRLSWGKADFSAH